MIAHLIGVNGCSNTSNTAKKATCCLKAGKDTAPVKDAGKANDKQEKDGYSSKKHKHVFEVTKKEMKQTTLKVFRGLDIPFSSKQTALVQCQFLQATISANLPFQWTKNAKVIKLFLMFQSTATDVMPSLADSCLIKPTRMLNRH